jgi:hypothetical protein
VLLLAAPEAGFITGQTLVVDGSYLAYGAAGPAAIASPAGSHAAQGP